jgi:hypothetical protein
MKKIIFVLLLFAVIILTAVSCSTTRDVRYNERRDDDGLVIRKRRTLRDKDDDRDLRIRDRKDRRHRHRNDEPVIIIDTDR